MVTCSFDRPRDKALDKTESSREHVYIKFVPMPLLTVEHLPDSSITPHGKHRLLAVSSCRSAFVRLAQTRKRGHTTEYARFDACMHSLRETDRFDLAREMQEACCEQCSALSVSRCQKTGDNVCDNYGQLAICLTRHATSKLQRFKNLS